LPTLEYTEIYFVTHSHKSCLYFTRHCCDVFEV